ncbi:hypothetical protein [Rhodococcus opacus]|uniref:hypothetical protein n=1 Tax=Rhodococcus opacus TaxID=37919 RepID=UPI000AA1AF6D|nr:hypothetical protein [Rhodococcus opacus]
MNEREIYKDLEWNEEFIRDVFERTDEHRHLPQFAKDEALAQAPLLSFEDLMAVLDSDTDEDYKDAVLSVYSASRPSRDRISKGISYCGTPGILPSSTVDVVINKEIITIELPEVEVWKTDQSYVTRMQQAEPNKVKLEYIRCMSYCYRYDLPTGRVTTEAMKHGLTWKEIQRLQDKAKRNAAKVKTIDVPLRDWFIQAVEHCNTLNQVDVLVWIYKEAATYTTTQPVVSKLRLAEQVGCDRVVVRRLVARLGKAGLLEEGPESIKEYDYKVGKPLSNARILNLDIKNPGRWWMMELAPAPDRSEEKKSRKQRKMDVLKNNGYWMGRN